MSDQASLQGAVVHKVKPHTTTTAITTTRMTPLGQQTRPCRLLNLPAELRNLIYSKIFEDTSRRRWEVAIAIAHKHAPDIAITQTNQQLRQETRELYLAATALFWRRHQLHIPFDCASNSKYRDLDEIVSMVRALRRQDPGMRAEWMRCSVETNLPCGYVYIMNATVHVYRCEQVEGEGPRDDWMTRLHYEGLSDPFLRHTGWQLDATIRERFKTAVEAQLKLKTAKTTAVQTDGLDVEMFLRAICYTFWTKHDSCSTDCRIYMSRLSDD